MKKKLWIYCICLTFAMSLSVSAGPTVNSGTADVDGDYSEWNLTDDFFAHMYEAGDPTKTNLSDLFLRYDCSTGTLYSLVLRTSENVADISPTGNAWLKLYTTGNDPIVSDTSGDDGIPPDFAWVYDATTPIGYEASAYVAPGTYEDAFEAHINIVEDRTSSTGKKKESYTTLTIKCDKIPPVPAPGALLLGGLGASFVGFIRRRISH